MMRRAALVLVLLTLAALASASSAHASGLEAPTYPGERAADERTHELVDVARAYWQARGVTGCPEGIAAFVADDLTDPSDGANGLERGGSCRVWMRTDVLEWMRAPGPRSEQRHNLLLECTMTLHGVGHALGLEHTERGPMSANWVMASFSRPPECVRAAYAAFPPRPQAPRFGVVVRRPLVSLLCRPR
jgi:hypothetical protein